MKLWLISQDVRGLWLLHTQLYGLAVDKFHREAGIWAEKISLAQFWSRSEG
jgi:hypothetical protein